MIHDYVSKYTPKECVDILVSTLKEAFETAGGLRETFHLILIKGNGLTAMVTIFPECHAHDLIRDAGYINKSLLEYQQQEDRLARLYAVLYCAEIQFGYMFAKEMPKDIKHMQDEFIRSNAAKESSVGMLTEIHYTGKVQLRIYPFERTNGKVEFDGTEVIQEVPSGISTIQTLFPK